jgi:hypothetical protein
VKQKGLKVRSRSGFYGMQDGAGPSQPRTPVEELLAALLSPFGGGDIRVRMTALFHDDAKLGSYVTVLAHADARDLTFTTGADGEPQTAFEVVTMTFGDGGLLVAQSGTAFTMKASKGIEPALEQGITVTHNHQVKKPGGYQVRLALRDVASGRIGTANQYVDVPNIKNKRLAISGILLQQSRETASEAALDRRSAALRVFRPADALSYSYQILNPKQPERGPSVESQVIVYRDGQRIYAGEPFAATATVPENPKALFGAGLLQLGRSMSPGDYAVQIVVTDKLAGKKHNTANQWTDFQVEP